MRRNILSFIVFLLFIGAWSEKASTASSMEAKFIFNNCCNFSDNKDVLNSVAQSQCMLQLKKEVCQNIDPGRKKDCVNQSSSSVEQLLSLPGRCLKGFFINTSIGMLEFLWTMMKGMHSLFFESRGGTLTKEVGAFIQSARNYLNIQYEQAYRESSPPNQVLKTASQIGRSIFFFLYNSVQTIIENSFDEYQCLNSGSRSETVCQFISSVLIPPIKLFAILKYGIKGSTKVYPEVEKAIQSFFNQSRNLLHQVKGLKTKNKTFSHWNKNVIDGGVIGSGLSKVLKKQVVGQPKKQIKGQMKKNVEQVVEKNLLLDENK